MNKLEQKRAERKERILSEAKKLILERGISDGLMSELAVRAGISRKRLYDYYNNINEVLGDLMENVLEKSYLARIAATPDVDTPDNFIRYSILAFRYVSTDVHDDLLFLSLYGVYRSTNKQAKVEHKPAQFLLYEKQIRAGQEMGIFRTDKSLQELTAIVSHLLAGYTYHSETLSDSGRMQMLSEELLNRLADMVLAYLKNT